MSTNPYHEYDEYAIKSLQISGMQVQNMPLDEATVEYFMLYFHENYL